MQEIEESLKIVEQAVQQFPKDGAVLAKVPKIIKAPKGEAFVRIESPRGEIGCYIASDGKERAVPLEVSQAVFLQFTNFTEVIER